MIPAAVSVVVAEEAWSLLIAFFALLTAKALDVAVAKFWTRPPATIEFVVAVSELTTLAAIIMSSAHGLWTIALALVFK